MRKRTIGLLAALSVMAAVLPARGADMNLAPIYKAPAGTPCTQFYCVGVYGGINVTNEGANFDVLGAGLNGLASNGITLGGEVGLEYWNGKLFAALEGDFEGSVTQNGPGLGLSNHVSERGLFKLGYSLAQAFGGGATGAAPNPIIPSSLSVAMMTPYAIIGTEHQPWGWGLSTGAGVQALVATNWTISADYIHTNFNNAAFNSKISEQTDNAFVLHLDYHLNP